MLTIRDLSDRCRLFTNQTRDVCANYVSHVWYFSVTICTYDTTWCANLATLYGCISKCTHNTPIYRCIPGQSRWLHNALRSFLICSVSLLPARNYCQDRRPWKLTAHPVLRPHLQTSHAHTSVIPLLKQIISKLFATCAYIRLWHQASSLCGPAEYKSNWKILLYCRTNRLPPDTGASM